MLITLRHFNNITDSKNDDNIIIIATKISIMIFNAMHIIPLPLPGKSHDKHVQKKANHGHQVTNFDYQYHPFWYFRSHLEERNNTYQ